MEHSTTRNKTIWWIIGALFSIVLFLGGAGLRDVTNQLQATSNRLIILESSFYELRGQVNQINSETLRRLQRIEDKIDNIK